MKQNNVEVEIKLKVSTTLAEIGKHLRALGFKVAKRRVFESNILFDTEDLRLRHAGKLIRLRRLNKTSTLTYKGAPIPGRHKSREEIETQVSNPENLELVFGRLGYARVFRYEKFRTEYRDSKQEGVVTVDETPIGNFLEIEGNARWIDRTAKKLGYKPADYITKSYGSLYFSYCEEHGRKPSHMVFRR